MIQRQIASINQLLHSYSNDTNNIDFLPFIVKIGIGVSFEISYRIH